MQTFGLVCSDFSRPFHHHQLSCCLSLSLMFSGGFNLYSLFCPSTISSLCESEMQQALLYIHSVNCMYLWMSIFCCRDKPAFKLKPPSQNSSSSLILWWWKSTIATPVDVRFYSWRKGWISLKDAFAFFKNYFCHTLTKCKVLEYQSRCWARKGEQTSSDALRQRSFPLASKIFNMLNSMNFFKLFTWQEELPY